MKSAAALLVLLFALVSNATAAGEELVGKAVVIKTSKEGTRGMLIKGDSLAIGTLPKGDPAACAFKVVGLADGKVMFESVGKPGAFLNFYMRKFVLIERNRPDGHWRMVAPLVGKEGVSIQHVLSGRYLAEEKGAWQLLDKVEHKKEAVFFLQEQQ